MNYSSNLSNCWDGCINHPPSHKKSDVPTNQMNLKRYLFEFLPSRQDHIVERKRPQKKINFRCSTVQQLVFPRGLAITWIVKSHGWIKKDICVIFCLFDKIISQIESHHKEDFKYCTVQQLLFPRWWAITWIKKSLEGSETWIIKRTLCPRVGLPEDWI